MKNFIDIQYDSLNCLWKLVMVIPDMNHSFEVAGYCTEEEAKMIKNNIEVWARSEVPGWNFS